MSKLNIGRIPIMKGEFVVGKTYNRLWQVTYLGSTYQSKIDNNTSSPAEEVNGVIVHKNADKWLCIADATKAVNSAKGLSDEISRATSAENSIQTQVTNNKKDIDSHQEQITSNDEDIAALQNKTTQIKETVDSIAVSGGASVASSVTYDSTASGLNVENVQQAVDNLQSDKFDKENIVQESGNSTDKVMSQAAVSVNYHTKSSMEDFLAKYLEPNYSNIYDTVIENTWLNGLIDDNGSFVEKDNSFVCTDFIHKSPYGKLYFKTLKYNSTVSLYYYDKDKKFLRKQIYRFQDYSGFPTIDTQDEYEYVRISMYFAQITEYSGTYSYGVFKKKIEEYGNAKDNIAFSLSPYIYKPITYSGIWKAGTTTNPSSTDYIHTDILEKGYLAPISLHCLIYSCTITLTLYDENKNVISEYSDTGAKFILWKNLAMRGKYFSLQICYKGITSHSLDNICSVYTYVDSDSVQQVKNLPYAQNETLPVSEFHWIKEYCDSQTFDLSNKPKMFNTNEIFTIQINSQEDYDKLQSDIDSFVQNPTAGIKALRVKFGNGLFICKNTITLTDIDQSDIALQFEGSSDTKILAESDIYNLDVDDLVGSTFSHNIFTYKRDYDYERKFVDADFNEIPVSDTGMLLPYGADFALSDGIDTKIQLPNTYAFLKDKEEEYFKNSYIYLGVTYRRIICKVNSVNEDEEGKLMLYYTPIMDSGYTNDYSNHKCYNWGKVYPRFWITNIEEMICPNSVAIIGEYIYVPKSTNKLYDVGCVQFSNIQNCKFAEISIQGISFVGNGTKDKKVPTIYFRNCSNIHISRNKFHNLYCGILIDSSYTRTSVKDESSMESENIRIHNNDFYNIVATACSSSADNNAVYGNTFRKCGYLGYEMPAYMRGKDYLFRDNKIIDFCWCAFSTSGGYGSRRHDCWNSGIIEDNEIYRTEDFNNKIPRYSLMDGGAMYLFVYNDGLIVRNNIIHDIKGFHDTRGIYCDDGGSNIYVLNNLLYNITWYAIEMYRVNWNSGNTPGEAISVDRRVLYNIVLGVINFSGSYEYANVEPTRENNGCYYGVNLIGDVTCDTSYSVSDSTPYAIENNVIDDALRLEGNLVNTSKDLSNWGFDYFIKSRLQLLREDTSIF